MSLVCAHCSRVNPPDAAYCYHDGTALAGRASGPINAGSAPFPNQFVFPSGATCRNFDQLAMACQQNWTAAIDLLKQGYLGSFFGGLGRVDLAMAAQEAAKFPDIDRGLDQLLSKLPTQALQSPKLQAEPSEINLGQLSVGQDRASELHLTNLGMRLLYGNVTSDCKWLTLGDTPGHPEKIFQFGTESMMAIQVRGQHLRAGSKPLEGHLVIDSNGGTLTVTVRADVPITPFSGGPFDGAVTPRQIAEKAKANPKEGAPFFESGAIAKWYAGNGWNYPVQGPTMPGTGAIQQFFEALGVAKPPKVEFATKALDLQGAVGQSVQAQIEVTTTERKVVYAWATCDDSWVEVGKTKLSGKSATIPITIQIPSPAPRTMETQLNVMANGNQKARIPVKITVAGGKKGVVLEQPEEIVAVEIIEEEPVVLPSAPKSRKTPVPVSSPGVVTIPTPVVTVPPPIPAPTPSPSPYAFTEAAAPAPAKPPTPPPPVAEDNPFALNETPASSGPGSAAPPIVPLRMKQQSGGSSIVLTLCMMLVPVALLGTCLVGLIVRDIGWAPEKTGHVGPNLNTNPAAPAAEELIAIDPSLVDTNPHVKLVFDEGTPSKEYSDSMNFAVHKIDPKNKEAESVKLNYYENGLGNSVVVRVDDRDYKMGELQISGDWTAAAKDMGRYGGRTRTFEFAGMAKGIFLTQSVMIVPGDPPGDAADSKRPLNLCLAKYRLVNRDEKKSRKVGLRVLLDTCIGKEDGVPFSLPGVNQLVSTAKDFKGKDVPDFVQVLEKPDLQNPGIVVHLNMRINNKFEFPNRFLLTRYPVTDSNNKGDLRKWDVKVVDFRDDSCVVMYWEEKEMKPNEVREIAFAYGLGTVTFPEGAGVRQLGLSIGGAQQVGGELTVMALVADPKAKTATLHLPEGLKLIDGQATQAVPMSRTDEKGAYRPVPLTWRVRAEREGKHLVEVTTDSGLKQGRRVTITLKSLFN